MIIYAVVISIQLNGLCWIVYLLKMHHGLTI